MKKAYDLRTDYIMRVQRRIGSNVLFTFCCTLLLSILSKRAEAAFACQKAHHGGYFLVDKEVCWMSQINSKFNGKLKWCSGGRHNAISKAKCQTTANNINKNSRYTGQSLSCPSHVRYHGPNDKTTTYPIGFKNEARCKQSLGAMTALMYPACRAGQLYSGGTTCSTCPSNTYQASGAHHFASCTAQPVCGQGQMISGDSKTSRRACSTCPSNTYQTSGSHRSTSCITQQICGQGDTISADSKTSRRTCSSCPSNTYQDSTSHQLTSCITQPMCSQGQMISEVLILVELSGSNDVSAQNLQACTGECDADSQCTAGLKCFQRDNGETIPGCSGPGDGPSS